MLRAVDELVLAPIWRLAMDPTGNTACTIQFHDGTCVEADANLAIFNRIGWSTSPAFRDASETDAAYAAMETHALLLSWLAAHPGPVLNPPQANGLSGLRASRLGWRVLAMRTGLPVCPWFVTSSAREFPPPPGLRPTLAPDRFIDPLVAIAGDRFAEFDAAGPDAARTTALVVGDRVVASLPESYQPYCVALARSAATPLLSLEFVRVGQYWCFDTANPMPSVTGELAIAEIATQLENAKRPS